MSLFPHAFHETCVPKNYNVYWNAVKSFDLDVLLPELSVPDMKTSTGAAATPLPTTRMFARPRASSFSSVSSTDSDK